MTTQTTSRPDLTALLGSRICHDLISPLGAIGNGVELLQMTGDAGGPEMQLIADSVRNANARIRFFRVAFGAASPDQRIGRAELGAVLDDSYQGGRVAVDHDLHDDMVRADAKLALLVLLCIESAMPLGGNVTLAVSGTHWQLGASAKRLKINDRLWSTLTQTRPPDDVTASEVQFALLPLAAAAAGRALAVTLGDTTIEVRF